MVHFPQYGAGSQSDKMNGEGGKKQHSPLIVK